MMIGKIDDFGIVQRAFRHDLRVPVGGPAFVHDLGLRLRREVVRLFANHPEHVALPVFQRRVFEQEEQDIFLRIFRKAPPLLPVFLEFLLLLLEEFFRIDEFVHVIAGGDLLDDRRVRPRQLVRASSCVR